MIVNFSKTSIPLSSCSSFHPFLQIILVYSKIANAARNLINSVASPNHGSWFMVTSHLWSWFMVTSPPLVMVHDDIPPLVMVHGDILPLVMAHGDIPSAGHGS